MDADSDKKQSELWEEIDGLMHIGRSAKDIEQALSMRGYDNSLLKEILTVSFMERLMEKEESFVNIEQSINHQAAERAEKEEHETLKQKIQEQQVQKQKMEADLLRQHEEDIKNAEDEKKRTDFEEERTRGEYLMKVKEGQEQERQQAEEEEDKKQKQEEERRLRYSSI